MGRVVPKGRGMAVQAERRGGVVHHQELAELVPVRVMAGGALKLLIVVQPHLLLKGHGIAQLAIGSDQSVVVRKGNRVMAREVGANAGRSRPE